MKIDVLDKNPYDENEPTPEQDQETLSQLWDWSENILEAAPDESNPNISQLIDASSREEMAASVYSTLFIEESTEEFEGVEGTLEKTDNKVFVVDVEHVLSDENIPPDQREKRERYYLMRTDDGFSLEASGVHPAQTEDPSKDIDRELDDSLKLATREETEGLKALLEAARYQQQLVEFNEEFKNIDDVIDTWRENDKKDKAAFDDATSIADKWREEQQAQEDALNEELDNAGPVIEAWSKEMEKPQAQNAEETVKRGS